VADTKMTYVMHDTGVTPGYWRAVSHNLNAVALECFIDECAAAAGKDPLAYRLSMIEMGQEKHKWSGLSAGVSVGPRIKAALEMVREKSGWGTPLAKGRGRGVAVMEGYNTVIAMVTEVTVSPAYDVSLDRVVAVVDAGPLVHPDQALAQMQSCINFGQSACMWGEITVNNNMIEQNNFDMYRVARMNEAPKSIEVHWVKPADKQPPGGLGEPGTAVVQPAIANAIYAASGKRVRVLPLTPENIRAS
jgi:isoquinoline 1-oxidoreductase beta subunit